jgi:hypothetical protein
MDRELAPAAADREADPALAPRLPPRVPPHRPLPDELRGLLERSYAADLSEVRVVEDGTAERLGKLAAARGGVVHVARGAYDPVGDAGRHVLAHEVAHVVQQGAAPTVGAAIAAEPGEVDFEAEANRAARAALRGEPARLSRGRAAVGFQGLDSWEHRVLGDLASGDAAYDFGDVRLTHGELQMLSGDYFGTETLSELLAKPSRAIGTEVGTRDEVIAAIQDARPWDHRFAKDGLWEHVTISDAVHAAMKRRFFARAADNIEHFQHPREHGDDARAAGHSYRAQHEAAIWKAYCDGLQGRGVERAMIAEAMSQHYLTDSFAAGHLRTPRADIKEFWDVAIPWFKTNFVNLLVERIARQLQPDGGVPIVTAAALAFLFGGLPGFVAGCWTGATALQARLRDTIHDKLLDTFGADGVPGFGEVVALVLHDRDNVDGVLVENDAGWRWTTYGDGTLAEHPEQGKPILCALELSLADIDHAHALGRFTHRHHEQSREEVLGIVHGSTPAPGRCLDSYGAEQIVPRPVAGANGSQTWRATGFDDLLGRPVRTDHPDRTFLFALVRECKPGGSIYDSLAAAGDSLEGRASGLFHPRAAFQAAVLAQVRTNPIQFLRDIVFYNP